MKHSRVIGLFVLLILFSACARQSTNRTTPPTNTPVVGDAPTAKPSVTTEPTIAKAAPPPLASTGSPDIHKIQHIVIIIQENRSFDTYFGTFPGAAGIPMKDGVPAVCVKDPQTAQCVKPHHNPNDKNYCGPHGAVDAAEDIDDGKMDGFVARSIAGLKVVCKNNFYPGCTAASQHVDVMGYHDAREISNYWTYAQQFVLQDHMFEPNASWSLPAHLFAVSAWSTKCTSADPMSCRSELQNPDSMLPRLLATACSNGRIMPGQT